MQQFAMHVINVNFSSIFHSLPLKENSSPKNDPAVFMTHDYTCNYLNANNNIKNIIYFII